MWQKASSKWIEKTSQLNEDFINNYNEECDEGYFLDIDVQFPKKLYEIHSHLPFLPERKKLKKSRKACY